MKIYLILFVFIAFSLSLYSADLIQENFSSYPAIPAGWTITGTQTSAWHIAGTTHTGGTLGEAYLGFSPSSTGTTRLISPVFDSRKVHDMTLTFKHLLDDYSTTNTYTIGVQISTNLTSWTTLWSVTGSSSIPASIETVSIPYTNGISEHTYIAFFFTGNNNDLNYWYLDDVLLTYANTLGYGIWPPDIYYPVGTIVVPHGYTMTIDPGSCFYFGDTTNLLVLGRLIVNGTETQHVNFLSVNMSSYWGGINFIYSDATDSSIVNYANIGKSKSSGIYADHFSKLRVSNSTFNTNIDSGVDGGCMHLVNSDIVVNNCTFDINTSDFHGGAIYSYASNFIFNRCNFKYNQSSTSSTIDVTLGNITMNDCNLTNNTTLEAALCLTNVPSATLNRCLIANNSNNGVNLIGSNLYINHCDIVNNVATAVVMDIVSACNINSSIIYANGATQIINNHANTSIFISYSCLQGGTSGVGGAGISSSYFLSNLSANPLFVSPTAGLNTSYNALIADWRLQNASPCINTGSPVTLDLDGSISDMGIYARQCSPMISFLADVTPDQGHQLDLRWKRSDIDVSFIPNIFYSVWREGASKASTGTRVANMSTFKPSKNISDYYYTNGRSVWYYLGQVPAVTFTDYGLIIPTAQDSSTTGTHGITVMVIFHYTTGIFQSITRYGYSVDNIPPDAARGIALESYSPSQLKLKWNPIATGTWAGNSYPEVNLITYRVYGSINPNFIPSPSNYIMATTTPEAVLTRRAESRFFYRIIAADSQ